mmetsp:Transcript_4253/g.12786  ORF Transcript_4253/g.12786 Transcript_4253/m.12786 type:complete len:225 (+) Transcript_4253:609-1283(+)
MPYRSGQDRHGRLRETLGRDFPQPKGQRAHFAAEHPQGFRRDSAGHRVSLQPPFHTYRPRQHQHDCPGRGRDLQLHLSEARPQEDQFCPQPAHAGGGGLHRAILEGLPECGKPRCDFGGDPFRQHFRDRESSVQRPHQGAQDWRQRFRCDGCGIHQRLAQDKPPPPMPRSGLALQIRGVRPVQDAGGFAGPPRRPDLPLRWVGIERQGRLPVRWVQAVRGAAEY